MDGADGAGSCHTRSDTFLNINLDKERTTPVGPHGPVPQSGSEGMGGL